MSRTYIQVLQVRVIDAALKDKLPARGAATRFGIGVATAVIWVRQARETGVRPAQGIEAQRKTILWAGSTKRTTAAVTPHEAAQL